VMNLESCCDSSGKDWDMVGKSLGIYSANPGRNQGNHQRFAGKNLSGNRLDVGVSKKNWSEP
jgi:hypothetical protein